MSTINQNTKIPLIAAWLAIVASAGATFQATRYLASIEHSMEEVKAHIRDDWVRADHERWAFQLKLLNPSLAVPEVTDTNRTNHIK